MANEKRMIYVDNAISHYKALANIEWNKKVSPVSWADAYEDFIEYLEEAPTVDAVEVVRCQNCVHAEPLDRNCELSTSLYMHCKLWRGDETKNVWHKYKKYYKDYSLVERDGYCDAGAKMDGGNEDG